MINMSNDSKVKKSDYLKPQEEFLRQVVFLKDDEKILAVFPFYHEISDAEYDTLVDTFFEKFEEEPPPKQQFCLMNEETFGWGWVHNKMITHLEVAETEDYEEFRDKLLKANVIKDSFILNED